MYLIFIVYDATAHKMCPQILLQNKPAKFYQETNIEISVLYWEYIKKNYLGCIFGISIVFLSLQSSMTCMVMF